MSVATRSGARGNDVRRQRWTGEFFAPLLWSRHWLHLSRQSHRSSLVVRPFATPDLPGRPREAAAAILEFRRRLD
jgi:hypothetical protein